MTVGAMAALGKHTLMPYAKRNAVTLGLMGGGAAMTSYGNRTDSDFAKVAGIGAMIGGGLGNRTVRSMFTQAGRQRLAGRFVQEGNSLERRGMYAAYRAAGRTTASSQRAHTLGMNRAAAANPLYSMAGGLNNFNRWMDGGKAGRAVNKHAASFMNFFNMPV